MDFEEDDRKGAQARFASSDPIPSAECEMERNTKMRRTKLEWREY
jgi:hypothetical protein